MSFFIDFMRLTIRNRINPIFEKIVSMQTFIKPSLVSLLCFFCSAMAISQADKVSNPSSFEIGIELQAYPTGIIPGIRLEKFIGDKQSFNLRLGYQIIDHRDLGVQDDEIGSGYGFSLAYRRFFISSGNGLSLAFRTDVWFNEMDWETQGNSGTTNITVIQPTLMGEYVLYSGSTLSITPSLSFGYEWNVSTEGEPTGEGAILLIGCTFSFGI